MKILSIIGSPRFNGNTHFLAQKFCEGAQSVGAETEEIFLPKMKVGPCLHCFGCLETGVCRQEDDGNAIIEKMRASDGILLSTPVYCCSVTAQMKAFIDRSYCMSYPTWETGMEGKTVAFIVGSGAPPPEDPSKAEEIGYMVHHKMKVPRLLKLARDWKMVQAGLNLRDALDPMGPFDPTIDTIKLLYQYSAILGMEMLGAMDFVGLGHNKKASQSRPQEIQRATMFGARFAMMTRMILDGSYV